MKCYIKAPEEKWEVCDENGDMIVTLHKGQKIVSPLGESCYVIGVEFGIRDIHSGFVFLQTIKKDEHYTLTSPPFKRSMEEIMNEWNINPKQV